MEKKHTPGPWELVEGSYSAHCCFDWSILPPEGTENEESFRDSIAEVLSGNKADARLISAAPELFDLLVELLESDKQEVSVYPSAIEGGYCADLEEWANRARAAIAKARPDPSP